MGNETTGQTTKGFVDAGGLRTYYEAEGAGEPLVLLHGGYCTVETFAGLTPLLAERYRVYLPERRAHGRTPDIDGPLTYDVMAQDTIAFLEAIDLPPSHLVGWSDGAIVALLVALRRPDLVCRIVLIGQPINFDGMPPEARAALEQESMPEMALADLRAVYADVSPDGPDHWDVVVAKIWRMWQTEPNIALSELAKVAVPTLVLIGDNDFATVEHAEAMQRALPDGRLEVVPDANHGLPMDQPDVVARQVLDFLGSTDA